MRVVICGGGAIGASIAYFLSLRQQCEVVVVERCGVACAASGKSGGFLARDWCDGTPVAPLARRSFALHATLGEAADADWGYRRVETLSVIASARRDLAAHGRVPAPDWLGAEVAVTARIGTPETTAQLDPAAFTRGMMDRAVAHGAALHIGAVEGVERGTSGAVAGVRVDGESVAADAVVVAMGPWSILSSDWLPVPAVSRLKGHSLLFRYRPPGPPHALFAEFETADGAVVAPEIYPRADGTTYACGLPGDAHLPADPAAVAPDAGGPERLRDVVSRLVPSLADAEILERQACHRPIVHDGMPLIGRVGGVDGAYLATGHSVWGILNAPATGEAMAELIVDGAATTVDIAPFDPARLPPRPRAAVLASD